MAFDITSVLRSVSDSDTGAEQIVYLPIDRLDADENNFYSLAGIDQLADNIATVGLQQPLRVRPGSEPGRYTIVSGHRRRAAIQILLDSEDGSGDPFQDGVACIIESGEASAALQELRLIYANSATRVMGAAEISRQAERVQALLYQLKEEGMEFPGRMRDHVAEACQVSKTKIARLHAIRENLNPVFLDYFDRGELPEETAYQLQRLPKDIQDAAGDLLAEGKKTKLPTSEVVAEVNRHYEKMMADMPCRAHAGGPDCHHKAEKVVRSIFQRYSWDVCPEDRCCRDCYKAASCSGACRECKDRRQLDKAVEAEKAEAAEKEKEAKQKAYKWQRRRIAKRLLPLIEAAGLQDSDELPSTHAWNQDTKISEIRDAAAGEFGEKYFYDAEILPTNTAAIKKWADKLHCSVDFLLDRTDDPKTADQIKAERPTVSDSDTAKKDPPSSPAGPQWSTGTPTELGMYETRIGVGAEETEKTACWQRLTWDGELWHYPRTENTLDRGMKVFRWVKLPEV